MSTHQCPAPGCTVEVPREKLACRTHWYQIPKAERDAVWFAFRAFGMGSAEHMNAVMDAVETLRG